MFGILGIGIDPTKKFLESKCTQILLFTDELPDHFSVGPYIGIRLRSGCFEVLKPVEKIFRTCFLVPPPLYVGNPKVVGVVTRSCKGVFQSEVEEGGGNDGYLIPP